MTAAWQYRQSASSSRTGLWLEGVLPALGGMTLIMAGVWSLRNAWDPARGYTSWTMSITNWHVGGVFIIGLGAFVVGIIAMVLCSRREPEFFAGKLAPSAGTDW